MQSEEPVNTIMLVSGRKPQAIIEQDLQRRGLKVEWANSIKAAKGFARLSIRENGHRRGPRLGGWQLDRSGRASKVYLKLHSHCACEFYQYGRVVVGRAGLGCGGYFVGTVIGLPLVRNPRALDRSVTNGQPSRVERQQWSRSVRGDKQDSGCMTGKP